MKDAFEKLEVDCEKVCTYLIYYLYFLFLCNKFNIRTLFYYYYSE